MRGLLRPRLPDGVQPGISGTGAPRRQFARRPPPSGRSPHPACAGWPWMAVRCMWWTTRRIPPAPRRRRPDPAHRARASAAGTHARSTRAHRRDRARGADRARAREAQYDAVGEASVRGNNRGREATPASRAARVRSPSSADEYPISGAYWAECLDLMGLWTAGIVAANENRRDECAPAHRRHQQYVT